VKDKVETGFTGGNGDNRESNLKRVNPIQDKAEMEDNKIESKSGNLPY
jgi:hypothetical protein